MNCKSYVHQISKISPIERVRSRAVVSEQRCVVVDQQCRESKGKAKIEGYMSIFDEEAHHRGPPKNQSYLIRWKGYTAEEDA